MLGPCHRDSGPAIAILALPSRFRPCHRDSGPAIATLGRKRFTHGKHLSSLGRRQGTDFAPEPLIGCHRRRDPGRGLRSQPGDPSSSAPPPPPAPPSGRPHTCSRNGVGSRALNAVPALLTRMSTPPYLSGHWADGRTPRGRALGVGVGGWWVVAVGRVPWPERSLTGKRKKTSCPIRKDPNTRVCLPS